MKLIRALKAAAAVAALSSAAAVVGTAHAENTDRSKAEPACQSSDVILCENWEDGDWVGWNDYNAGDSINNGGFRGGITCATGDCLLPYPGYNNSKAVALVLPRNKVDAIYPKGVFNEKVDPNQTLYARWRVYWSPGFEFNTNTTKNMYFITDAGSSGGSYRVAFQLRPADRSDLTIAVPYIQLYTNQIDVAPGSWQEDDSRRRGGEIRYLPNQPGASEFRIETGRWYEIEMRVTPNPQGQSFGGRLQYWIDGQLLADHSDNVSIRKKDDKDMFDGVWLSTYFGGGGQTEHPEQYVVYDDIIVSKSRIGGQTKTPIELAPPSSPVLRSIQ